MKKQLIRSALIAACGIALTSGVAVALPSGPFLQNAIDTRTKGGSSSVNVSSDMLNDNGDSHWRISASGGSTHTILFENSGFANSNSFGIYDISNPSKKLQLFAGAAKNNNTPFMGAVSTLYYFDGIYSTDPGFSTYVDFGEDRFGYYLEVPDENTTYYSDTDLNEDDVDHMLAYQGTGADEFSTYNNGQYAPWSTNEYILAWEDLYKGGEEDYDDFVIMVESVSPVPEPATMLLFGAGLVALAGYSRKK